MPRRKLKQRSQKSKRERARALRDRRQQHVEWGEQRRRLREAA